MIQFYLLFLLYVVILQPITVVIGFILRFMYHPPKQKEEHISTIESINKMCNDRLSTLDLNYLYTNGDCAKFLGMYYWATNYEYAWDKVMQLCDLKNKCFHRTPVVISLANEVKFSGDMLSGFMGAIAHRLTKIQLTDYEKSILGPIWNYSSFSRWPMLLNHTTKGKSFDRGFIWAPWRLWDTMDIVRLLTWLYLGYKVTDKKRYLITFYLVELFTLPALLLATHDGSFFIGKIYGISPHASHSNMLNVVTGYMLSKNFIFKNIMARILKRRETTSPDTLALWDTYFDKLTPIQESNFNKLIYSTYIKGSLSIPENEYTKYLSIIWPPKIVYNGKYLYPPSYRGNDYSDERSLIKGNLLSEVDRDKWSLDVIFPSMIKK